MSPETTMIHAASNRLGLARSLFLPACLSASAGCVFVIGDDASDASDDPSTCGPTQAEVTRVIDGDTIEVEADGETFRIRYLMIDTPESTVEQECWGEEAKAANVSFVDGKTVDLRYDVECEDKYDRLLAYVEVGGQDINRVMVERGYACVLHIPPNGDDVTDEYEQLEAAARDAGTGLWGACEPRPCG